MVGEKIFLTLEPNSQNSCRISQFKLAKMNTVDENVAKSTISHILSSLIYNNPMFHTLSNKITI